MTPQSVETRAAKVALASGLSMFLAVALQLVSVPVCLHFWGKETYGLWLALFALYTVIRTPDTGFSAYVGNELNLLYHRDQVALRRTLASALAGALVVGVAQLAAAIAIVWSGRLPDLLGVAPEAAEDARAGFAIVVLIAGWVLTGPYLGIVHKLQVPAGMLHQATWWLMGYQIAQAAALVLAAALRLDISEAAVLFSAAQVIVYVASAAYVARKLPDYFPWWRRPSWRVGLRDLYRSSVMMGAGVLVQIGASGLVMLISSGVGAAAVPAFTTVRTLANVWTMLGTMLIAPLLPEVVRYHAQRDGKKLVAALEAHWLIASCTINFSILAVFPFVDDLYRQWTQGGVALDQPLLCYLLLSVVVASPVALITNYLVGINELRAVTALNAARGLVPLATGALLLPSLGIAGVGIGVVLGEVIASIGFGLPLFRRQLRGLADVPAAPAWRSVAVGSCAVAIFLIARATDSPHVGTIYALALAVAIGSAFWSWRRVGSDVRQRAIGLLRRGARVS